MDAGRIVRGTRCTCVGSAEKLLINGRNRNRDQKKLCFHLPILFSSFMKFCKFCNFFELENKKLVCVVIVVGGCSG